MDNAMNAAQVVDTHVFPRATWEAEGSPETGDYAIKGIVGTWTKIALPSPEIDKKIHGLACCPKCGQLTVLSETAYKVDRLGHLHPLYYCKYADDEGATCGLLRDAYLDQWTDGKFLYALSHHSASGIRIEYTHVETVAEARSAFPWIKARNIIAIGRAVGFAGGYADAATLAHAEGLSL